MLDVARASILAINLWIQPIKFGAKLLDDLNVTVGKFVRFEQLLKSNIINEERYANLFGKLIKLKKPLKSIIIKEKRFFN